jgi:hypothetical protein
MQANSGDDVRALASPAPGTSTLAWLRLKGGRRTGRFYLSGIMPSKRLGHALGELEGAAGGRASRGDCTLERRRGDHPAGAGRARHVDDPGRDP